MRVQLVVLVLGMVAPAVLALGMVALASAAPASVRMAHDGRALSVILTQPGATEPERLAAAELAAALQRITGATFEVREEASEAPANAIIVGPGPLARRWFAGVDLEKMGMEQGVAVCHGGRLLLAGGRPRGTLYAVFRFLQERVGVRWWAPWASHYPSRPRLSLREGRWDFAPAFEARDPFWYPAFDANWAMRNGSNSMHSRLTEAQGGKIVYRGFVHTFFTLVPPARHFASRPEWFSLIDGQRRHEGAQLCTTNPDMRAYMVDRVREWLRESPDARIVSISQNDWYGPCECAPCKAIDEREGTHAGTMLELVNYVAARLGPEFPHVAFDTLAYQYTRKPTRSLRPAPNVIVRLCSIECNFAEPLEHPSNAAFADDIRGWNRVSDRLYVWDYVTNFAHYVMPHPNYFVLGPNVRFFHRHGVKGLFEQGAYQSHGSEMAEMRAWVLAQLMWNPYQDDRKLIREFLDGYYGREAARSIWQYLLLMQRAARGFHMGCFTPPTAPYLRFATLRRAEQLWEAAERAASGDPERLWRVRQGRLPVWYAWLVRWPQLRREHLATGGEWPVPTSRRALADRWLAVATGPGPQGWAPMTHINEGGTTPQAFVARFATDAPDPEPIGPLPRRGARPPAPADVPGAGRRGVDLQDDAARLHEEGVYADLRGDRQASDGIAAWMPGTHNQWAVQFPFSKVPEAARVGQWHVYVTVRVERESTASPSAGAFSAGVYDPSLRASHGELAVTVGEASGSYRSYRVATVTWQADIYVWVAPVPGSGVKGVWVDRVYLVPA
ncbi:MAG TPA: DUF4838 domain-containing protein [Chthonomonadales bacterium]|nr:DUF4838 domain-containing protein [Chthonomonadales bacterium]